VAAVLGGAAIVFGHFSDSLNRLASVHGSSDAATMNGRVYLWNAAFDLIGKFPILGIGSGTFHTISATFPGVDYTETGLPAHNTYLSVFAELGAIGFLLFMAVIGAAIWAARHTEPGYRLAYLCSLAAFIIGSSALTYETHSQEWLLFILILSHCCMRQPRPITAVPVTT
jgi:O-antigen ligase